MCGIVLAMNTLDAIQHMIDVSGMPKSELSRRMGKARTFVSTTLFRRSIPRADTLAEMAQRMGYSLVLRGHDEEIVIDADDACEKPESAE